MNTIAKVCIRCHNSRTCFYTKDICQVCAFKFLYGNEYYSLQLSTLNTRATISSLTKAYNQRAWSLVKYNKLWAEGKLDQNKDMSTGLFDEEKWHIYFGGLGDTMMYCEDELAIITVAIQEWNAQLLKERGIK